MERFKIAGVEYLGHDCLTFGDYGGAGSLGAANIRYIQENHKDNLGTISWGLISDISKLNENGKDSLDDIRDYSWQGEKYFSKEYPWNPPEILEAYGDYASQSVFVRSDIWDKNEYGESLENYPAFDDEIMSEIEMEWEDEAFNSWAESDLISSCSDRTEEKLNDMLPGERVDITWAAYRAAMETENKYPETEYSGSHIPIDEIAETFERHAITLLKGETIKNAWDKTEPDLLSTE